MANIIESIKAKDQPKTILAPLIDNVPMTSLSVDSLSVLSSISFLIF